jgi:hypothetical protein
LAGYALVLNDKLMLQLPLSRTYLKFYLLESVFYGDMLLGSKGYPKVWRVYEEKHC